VKSPHPDKTDDVMRAAQWRVEQPDDEPPPTTTAPPVPGSASPFANGAGIPTSATPPPTTTTPATPPPQAQPY
jgi:hypothetical protein